MNKLINNTLRRNLCQVMCRKHGGVDKKRLAGKEMLLCCTYYKDV